MRLDLVRLNFSKPGGKICEILNFLITIKKRKSKRILLKLKKKLFC